MYTPFGWKGQRGQYTDSETGFVYCRARYYSPALGRFLSRDPSGFSAGPNLYSYCAGDPINFFDATGFGPESNEAARDEGLLWGGIRFAADVESHIPFPALFWTPLINAHDKMWKDGGIAGNQKSTPDQILQAQLDAALSFGSAAAAATGPVFMVVGAVGEVTAEAGAVGTAIGETGSEAGQITSNITQNRAAGNSFRDEIAELFRNNGYNVRTEVPLETPYGPRIMDIEVWKNGERLGGIETKVGGSRYHWHQRLKDDWLTKRGNYPVNLVRDR